MELIKYKSLLYRVKNPETYGKISVKDFRPDGRVGMYCAVENLADRLSPHKKIIIWLE